MTEEIIIDGVNVVGCKRYGTWGGLCGLSECGGLCKDLPECDYKTIDRLKQENEKVIELAKKNADAFEYCLQGLEEELKPFQDEYFQGLTKQQIAELAKKSIRLTADNCKLTHALEDIREIADVIYNTNCNYIQEAHNILNKVNEVL